MMIVYYNNIMKKQLLFTLISLGVLTTGCLKQNNDTTPVVQPQGKFSGTFYRIHKAPTVAKFDTIKLSMQIELLSNTFKITGDTTKHAGSFGNFDYNQSQIQWIDATVPAGSSTVKLPKYHLNGIYNYSYNGTALKFEAYNDTLKYFYDLKKQAN
jgi:hypothetical protein